MNKGNLEYELLKQNERIFNAQTKLAYLEKERDDILEEISMQEKGISDMEYRAETLKLQIKNLRNGKN